jgi:hypothetical protein
MHAPEHGPLIRISRPAHGARPARGARPAPGARPARVSHPARGHELPVRSVIGGAKRPV